jgi:hypothetical protein
MAPFFINDRIVAAIGLFIDRYEALMTVDTQKRSRTLIRWHSVETPIHRMPQRFLDGRSPSHIRRRALKPKPPR